MGNNGFRRIRRHRMLALPAVALLVAACSTTGYRGGPAPDLAGSRWTVSLIGGDQPLSGAALTVSFSVDGRVNGDSGCNLYSGPYIQDGSEVQFGELLSTRRACLDDSRQRQENLIQAILQGKVTARRERDGDLHLAANEGSLVLRPDSVTAAR